MKPKLASSFIEKNDGWSHRERISSPVPKILKSDDCQQSSNKSDPNNVYNNSTTSSCSNESGLSSNRIYRPPSEFGDSKEYSDAECDRRSWRVNQRENNSDKSNSESDQSRKSKVPDLDKKMLGTSSNEDSIIIPNRLYEQNDSPHALPSETCNSENTAPSESDKSSYSINV